MKVALVDVEGPGAVWNKDQAGSFGTRIQSGHSIFSKFIDTLKRTGIRLPVLYLAYANAILRGQGHVTTHHICDFPKDADLVIVPSSIVDCENELAFADRVKRESHATVGALGAFASVNSQYYLRSFDFVIVGEPENALLQIARGEGTEQLRGAIKSELVGDLDSLPFPDWTGFPVDRYRYYPTLSEKPFLTILSSRGCPYHCSYCPYIVLQGTTFRKRSVSNVVEEIQRDVNTYGVEGLLFRDPVFTLDKQRVIHISREILRRRISIRWCCETRADCLDKPLVDEMCQAGMKAINLGVESPNEAILQNASRKTVGLKHQEEMIDYLEGRGVKVVAFYILGFPDDTEETVRATIEYAKRLNTTLAQFTILTPYPGTKYYDQVRDLITTSNWASFDGYTPVVRNRSLTAEELLRLKEKAFCSYYLRSSWMFRKALKAIS